MDFFPFLESLYSYDSHRKSILYTLDLVLKLCRFGRRHEENSLPFCKYPAFVTAFTVERKLPTRRGVGVGACVWKVGGGHAEDVTTSRPMSWTQAIGCSSPPSLTLAYGFYLLFLLSEAAPRI